MENKTELNSLLPHGLYPVAGELLEDYCRILCCFNDKPHDKIVQQRRVGYPLSNRICPLLNVQMFDAASLGFVFNPNSCVLLIFNQFFFQSEKTDCQQALL